MRFVKHFTDILLYISLAVGLIGAALFILPHMLGCEIEPQTDKSFDARTRKGSLVYFEKCDPAGISIGDIAIFEKDNEKTIDCITYIDYETNRVYGLSVNDCKAQTFRFDELSGRRVTSLDGLGYIYSYASSKDGMTVIISVLLFILVISVAADTVYALYEKRRKRIADRAQAKEG